MVIAQEEMLAGLHTDELHDESSKRIEELKSNGLKTQKNTKGFSQNHNNPYQSQNKRATTEFTTRKSAES